jgi:alkylation response protein AidB-like acyl-CoA dehydrogenase
VVETAAVGVPLLARFAPELLKNDELLRGGLTATMGDTVPYATAGACVVLGEHTIDLRRLVEFDALDALDRSRGVARLDVDDTASARVIAEGPDAREAYDAACDRAAAATAAVLVGLSRRALQMTVEYVGVRRQFGVPIGSFQAVKHHLANAHTAVEMAVPLVHAAAWAHAEDPSQARQLSSMAKVMANKAGRVTAKAALQCHGAIGYTTESDLHLYLMRIWSLLNAWGGTGDHVDRVAVEAGF